jgi:predicted hotdog family 3-hydroxylacyl-ACP dehydratase
VQYPTGYSVSYAQSVSLIAGETYTASVSLIITGTDPKGVYSLTVAAADGNGTSSATATVTVS